MSKTIPNYPMILRSFPICLILFFLIPLDKCGDNKIKKVVEASDRLIANVREATELTNALGQSHKITDAEWKNLTDRLNKAKDSVIRLNERAQAISKDRHADTSANREEIAKLLSNAVKSISQFKGAGVSELRLEVQEQFRPILKKMSLSIRTAIAAVNCPPINANCVKCEPDPPGEVICVP